LFSGDDFKDAAPFLFGEKFGALAKECLEASEALRKSVVSEDIRVFRKATPRLWGWQPAARQERREDGKPLATKSGKDSQTNN